MRPCDEDERPDIGLFEQWMGITPEEWEALGTAPDVERVIDESRRS